MTDISGKSILVVGASGGLGAPIARALAAAGARLTLTGRDETTLAAVGVEGATLVTADLRDPDAPRRLIDGVVATDGAIHGLVIASGVVAFGPADQVDDETVEDLLLLNFVGPLRLTRAALNQLPEGGFVASISAIVAEMPTAGMGAYSASKAAISAFNTSARTEFRRRKIRVIDIRPPHTETGLADRPIAGRAPTLPTGLSPEAVAQRVLRAIIDDENDLGSAAFSS